MLFLCLSTSAQAQDVLWLSSITGERDGRLREAMEASLEVRLREPRRLRAELEAMAEELAPDAAEESRERALRRAREAYLELRLGVANAAYQDAARAAVGVTQAPPTASSVATIFFERFLVATAAQQRAEAAAMLRTAVNIHPGLRPDREVYGDPVFQALRRARQQRGRPRRLTVERAPADARVWVNGTEVRGDTVSVRGPGPHLVVASRPGHESRAQLVEAERVAIVLPPAQGALLARHALEQWPSGLDDIEGWRLVSRASGIERSILASGENEVHVRLLDVATGEVIREAAGVPLDWEPRPYASLGEALAGRTLERPPPEPVLAEPSIVVSAPSSVAPSKPLRLRTSVTDPDERLQRIVAQCGDQQVEGEPDELLTLRAPPVEGSVQCEVIGFGEEGPLATAPELTVEVRALDTDGVSPWWIGVGVSSAVVAIGIVIGAVFATRTPEQVLVIDGL